MSVACAALLFGGVLLLAPEYSRDTSASDSLGDLTSPDAVARELTDRYDAISIELRKGMLEAGALLAQQGQFVPIAAPEDNPDGFQTDRQLVVFRNSAGVYSRAVLEPTTWPDLYLLWEELRSVEEEMHARHRKRSEP
jgi:hypothetical protein